MGSGFAVVREVRTRGHTGHLDHLETDTGDITHSVTAATETSNQHLIVLLNEVQATVVGHEGSNLLGVLDQLHTGALADSGVGLLGLNTDLLQHNALGVRAAGKGLLPLAAQMALLVVLVRPQVLAALNLQLTTS